MLIWPYHFLSVVRTQSPILSPAGGEINWFFIRKTPRGWIRRGFLQQAGAASRHENSTDRLGKVPMAVASFAVPQYTYQ